MLERFWTSRKRHVQEDGHTLHTRWANVVHLMWSGAKSSPSERSRGYGGGKEGEGVGRASPFGSSHHELVERAADAYSFSFSSKSFHNHVEFPRSGTNREITESNFVIRIKGKRNKRKVISKGLRLKIEIKSKGERIEDLKRIKITKDTIESRRYLESREIEKEIYRSKEKQTDRKLEDF
uniref:Uncharacterized protein n=1 Tax=Vespula pensylvanica TaxID=30213 RepID=A0A834P8W6_VESPE|nr:hypothetical protein H0235_004709 [Vespula pensylvanica]